MPLSWIIYINVGLGSLVVTIGAWLAGNGLSLASAAGVAVAAAAFLGWRGRSIALVWAWSTLLLGLACLAWPMATMLQIRSGGAEPSDAEMGAILSATVMGLFSACFWIAFSYGLFKRAGGGPATARSEAGSGRSRELKKR
ncbi:MAG TPA: hypothetical protein VJR03_10055 [Nitrospira sp.]|nr:hypothetical protein [Nitrospira sp.]